MEKSEASAEFKFIERFRGWEILQNTKTMRYIARKNSQTTGDFANLDEAHQHINSQIVRFVEQYRDWSIFKDTDVAVYMARKDSQESPRFISIEETRRWIDTQSAPPMVPSPALMYHYRLLVSESGEIEELESPELYEEGSLVISPITGRQGIIVERISS